MNVTWSDHCNRIEEQLAVDKHLHFYLSNQKLVCNRPSFHVTKISVLWETKEGKLSFHSNHMEIHIIKQVELITFFYLEIYKEKCVLTFKPAQ
jgi:hypothetical protein